MNFKNRLTTTLIMGALSIPVMGQEGPDPAGVSIDSIAYRGSGCPLGTVASNISEDAQAMTLLFDDYIVATDDAPNQTSIKKSCQIDVGLNVPSGWSYALFCVDFRGYASLDDKISASQGASYRFGNRPPVNVGKLHLNGFYDNDYQHLTAIPLNTVSWSPCGTGQPEVLTIDTNIEVKKPKPKEFVWHKAHHAALMTFVWANNIYNVGRHQIGRNSPRANKIKAMKDKAHEVRMLLARRKPTVQVATKFQQMVPLAEEVFALIQAEPKLRDRRPTSDWFNRLKSEYANLAAFLISPAEDALGIMTVDSVDGELKHHYGIAWRKCGSNGGGQCENLPPQKKFGDGHAHNLIKVMQQKLREQGAPEQLIPSQPLRRTTNGSGGGFRWNVDSGTVDQATLDNFCNVMGYRKAVASTCHDAERSGRYPTGKCNYHSPGNNAINFFDGNKMQTQRGPDKYKTTWATTITCAEPINSCN